MGRPVRSNPRKSNVTRPVRRWPYRLEVTATPITASSGEPAPSSNPARRRILVHPEQDISATTGSLKRTDDAVLSGNTMARNGSRARPTPAIFYGYSVEVIQNWCGVSRQTACLYKCGARRPSKQALRLFILHRDGRVLGPEWREWAVHKNKLVSPEGQETTQGQLNAYWLVMQLARELTEKDPEARQEFYRILAAG